MTYTLRRWSILLCNLAFLFSPGSVLAESDEKKTKGEQPRLNADSEVFQNGFAYKNQLSFRHNPVGLADQITLGYRQKWGNHSPNDLLFGNSHVYTGLDLRLTTIVNVADAFILLEPIALLQIKASIGWMSSQQDGAVESTYDTAVFNNTTKALTNIAGASLSDGAAAKLQAQLRYKQGPIAIRNTTLFKQYLAMKDNTGSGYFYDPFLDVAIETNSAVLQNDIDLIAKHDSNPFGIGFRHTYVHPFKTPNALEDGDIHKAGLFFLWQFANKPHQQHFRDQYIVLLTQWHLKHPLRAGEATYEGEFDPAADPFQYTRSRWEPFAVLSWGFGGHVAKR